MDFKRIKEVRVNRYLSLEGHHIPALVSILEQIESKPYHDKVLDKQEDFDNIRRVVTIEMVGQSIEYHVGETDRRRSGETTWTVKSH